MKNIKLLIATLILITLCGCSVASDTFAPPDYPIIDAPDKVQQRTVDGYLKESEQQSNNDNILYYANTKTHKFHLPDCTYAERLSDANARLESDKEVLLLEGYSPCGNCNP